MDYTYPNQMSDEEIDACLTDIVLDAILADITELDEQDPERWDGMA